MRTATLVCLLAAASLAACGEKTPAVIVEGPPADALDPNTAPPPSPPSAEMAAGPAGAPGAAPDAAGAGTNAAAEAAPAAPDPNKPQRKAGLWQLTSTSDRGSSTSTLCVTAASEARYNAFARGGRGGGGRAGACQPRISKNGSNWRATTDCTNSFGDTTFTTKGTQTITGDLNTRYTMKSAMTMSGGDRGGQTMNSTVTGEYKGACPAGQKGGDMTMEDGTKRNVFDAPRGGFGGGRGPGGPGGGGRGG